MVFVTRFIYISLEIASPKKESENQKICQKEGQRVELENFE
jgi:hypothetical protein